MPEPVGTGAMPASLARAALAAQLVERGAKVYAAARRPETVDVPGVVPLRLDVTDEASVREAARASPCRARALGEGEPARLPLGQPAPRDQAFRLHRRASTFAGTASRPNATAISWQVSGP
jgi:hypothetical protein